MRLKIPTRNKGQVSSEYLVIMAVVLVIALVVVFLLKDFLTTGSGISESQSRGYWTVATPFSIGAQKYSGSTLDLDMQNTLSETATITSIEIAGTAYPMNQVFRLGERRVIELTISSSCGTPGDPYSLEGVKINYQRGSDAATQAGQTPLVGTCS